MHISRLQKMMHRLSCPSQHLKVSSKHTSGKQKINLWLLKRFSAVMLQPGLIRFTHKHMQLQHLCQVVLILPGHDMLAFAF